MTAANPPIKTAGNGAAEWLTPFRFALLLAGLLFATYPEVFLLRGTFFHRDFAAFGYPLAHYQREAFWRGEVPLWNPLNYCGLPFLAQWNTLTLYPPALFYLLLPLSWSLGFFCLGHLFFGGLGMFFLARRWTGLPLAAAVAGTAYTFNALQLHSLMWPNNIAALGWMPWVVLLVERAMQKGGRALVLAALAGAMQMLAGAPEVILLTWLVLAGLMAGLSLPAGLVQNSKFKVQNLSHTSFLRFSLVAGSVAGLSAMQLLPFLDLLAHSQRDTGFSASTWAMPVWGWANFLVPWFRCFPDPFGIPIQPEQHWVNAYYLGIVPVLLALFAVWRARQWRVWLLALLAVASLWLALGDAGWLYAAVRKFFPGLGFMRYPVKFTVLTTFVVPPLAAFAVMEIFKTQNSGGTGARRTLLTVMAVLIGLIGTIVWADHLYPFQNLPWQATAANALGRIVFLTLTTGLFLFWSRITKPFRHKLLPVSLPALLWLEMISSAPRPNPTVARDVYEPGFVRRELKLQPSPETGQARMMLSRDAAIAMSGAPLTNSFEQVLHARLGQSANLNLLDDLPTMIGSSSLYFRELEQILYLLYGPAPPPAALLDFLSVAFMPETGKNLSWTNRPSYLPWITGGQRPLFADGNAALAGVADAGFDPRRTVYLPGEAKLLIAVTNETGVKLGHQKFTPQLVEAEVETPQAALIIINQNWYHHWHAFVDGKAVRLWRANHAFQAVEVPAGRHTVRLAYVDRMFHLGMVISALTLLACSLIWRRTPPSNNPPCD